MGGGRPGGLRWPDWTRQSPPISQASAGGAVQASAIRSADCWAARWLSAGTVAAFGVATAAVIASRRDHAQQHTGSGQQQEARPAAGRRGRRPGRYRSARPAPGAPWSPRWRPASATEGLHRDEGTPRPAARRSPPNASTTTVRRGSRAGQGRQQCCGQGDHRGRGQSWLKRKTRPAPPPVGQRSGEGEGPQTRRVHSSRNAKAGQGPWSR